MGELFRAQPDPFPDFNGTQFWSGETNHCTLPGYESVNFTLPQGDYRFRADYDGVAFWSGELNHCTLPGCTSASVEIPGGSGSTTTIIDYGYDPLKRSYPEAKRRGNRLVAADYTSGEYFRYEYDAVGNPASLRSRDYSRLSEETHEGLDIYAYDIANRLISVNGVNYIWDDKGNLLSDGTSVYEYDHANRLEQVTQGSDIYEFGYRCNGKSTTLDPCGSDRVSQTINGATITYGLDQAAPKAEAGDRRSHRGSSSGRLEKSLH